MAIASELSRRSAGDEDRQRIVIVLVAVAHAAAVEHDRVIQQVAIAIRRRAQLFEEVPEHLHVITVDERAVERRALARPRPVLRVLPRDTGAGIGASHQTGWTGLIAFLIQGFTEVDAEQVMEKGMIAVTEASAETAKETTPSEAVQVAEEVHKEVTETVVAQVIEKVQQQVMEAVQDQGGQAQQIQEKVEQIVMEKIAEAVQKKADEVTVAETCLDEKKEVL
jgi:hypothetical protein